MRLPNGYGSVKKMSGKRRRPYAVKKTVGWHVNPETGKSVQEQITIGYAATRAEGLQMLAEYNNNPFDIKASKATFQEVYTNGFIHSKTFVSDDRTATVGTTNLDFRSLYLHYECGALLYEAKAVMEVKEDFLQTLEICQQVTEKDCKTNIVVHLLQDILRLFAPLM